VIGGSLKVLTSHQSHTTHHQIMDQKRLEELLTKFKVGEIGLDQAVEGLRHLPFES
jgi:hypothetical protein